MPSGLRFHDEACSLHIDQVSTAGAVLPLKKLFRGMQHSHVDSMRAYSSLANSVTVHSCAENGPKKQTRKKKQGSGLTRACLIPKVSGATRVGSVADPSQKKPTSFARNIQHSTNETTRCCLEKKIPKLLYVDEAVLLSEISGKGDRGGVTAAPTAILP